jgi:hypothetical protein
MASRGRRKNERLNMNTTKTTWLTLLFLSATLAGVFPTHAYYDPGAQRWINRDPNKEPGFEIMQQTRINASQPVHTLGPLVGRAIVVHEDRGLPQRVTENQQVQPLNPRETTGLYSFVLHDPINLKDTLGLKCLLNCFPWYVIDPCTGRPTIGAICFPVDDGTGPKCKCSGWQNLPPLNHWWIINKPVSPGTYDPGDFDPCADKPPGVEA